jgi:antitoxin component YwqK of YwqJK toxin-antitoxin module
MRALYFLLSLSLFISPAKSFAQKDTVRKYLDGNLHFTTRTNSVFSALAVRDKDHWVLYAVYYDTSLLLELHFKDAALTIKDGPFVINHPKKVRSQEGYYTDNVADGLFRSWYINGQIKDSGVILKNCYAGTWKHWYSNRTLSSEENFGDPDTSFVKIVQRRLSVRLKSGAIWDNLNPDGMLDGPFNAWYENGQKTSSGAFRKDRMEGVWTWYREDGTLSTKETYVNNKVVDLECYNEKGENTGSTCSVLKPPVLIHPFLSAIDYIIDRLHRLKKRDLEGEAEAEVTFTVTKDGILKDLTFKRSTSKAMQEQVAKIFAAMPPWSPAISHNRPVDFSMTMKIPFYR